ncbi:hypothetical protein OGAPHI_000757 [Ogataea philodendri]|uniref:Uncharacterized protein n=1 Tax=Ogataea philodendri TaxID=1378263 RepID=A0A9P8TAF2_9ASCO|nr:uncharacterized protein OGAPHI_000757 [Ogataea philodendri]KAH3671046.1 hypothetical protein OGAPHI_000757 [Ogataea philodendri]
MILNAPWPNRGSLKSVAHRRSLLENMMGTAGTDVDFVLRVPSRPFSEFSRSKTIWMSDPMSLGSLNTRIESIGSFVPPTATRLSSGSNPHSSTSWVVYLWNGQILGFALIRSIGLNTSWNPYS